MKVGDVSMRLMLDVQQAVKAAGDFEHSFDGIGDAGRKAAAQLTAQLQKMAADIEKLSKQGGGLGSGIGEGLEKVAKKGQVSASQTAAAWSQLPMQLQDVAVSLQGGMAPFTVAMQQGPQIVGAFGGVAPMFQAIAGALGPVGLAIGAVVAVVGGLGYAFYKGASEADAYRTALINTGNAAGLTVWQLQAMDKSIGSMAGFTRGQAAEALAMMAGAAGSAGGDLERLTVSALKFQRETGTALEDTAKAYKLLTDSPLEGLKKLNDGTNFLTASTYAQVKALQEAGNTQEASRVALDAYSKMMSGRSDEMAKSVSWLGQQWRDVSGDVRKAWDSMVGVGRAETVKDQLDAVEGQLAKLKARAAQGYSIFDYSMGKPKGDQEAISAAEQKAAALRAQRDKETAAAAQQRVDALKGKAVADADKEISSLHKQTDAVGELNTALAQYRKNVAAMAGTPLAVSSGQQARDELEIRKQHIDQQALALKNAALDADLIKARARADERGRIADKEAAALAHAQAMGLVSAEAAAQQSTAIEAQRLRDQVALIDQQIAAERKRPNPAGDPVQEAQRANKIRELVAQLEALNAKVAQVNAAGLAKADEIALERSRSLSQQWAAALVSTQNQMQAWADQAAQLQASMIEAPVAAALAQADLAAAQMARQAAKLRADQQTLINQLRANGQGGQADGIEANLNKMDAQAAQAQALARQKVVMDYLKDSTAGLASGWDRVTQAIGGSVQAMLALATEEKNYEAALKAAGKDQGQIAQVQAKHAKAQMRSYAAMADAAKGYFKEGSKGYKAMDAASKVFRAAEMAMAIKSALQKIGLIEGETAAKISGDAVAVASSQAAATAETAAAMQAGTANATAAVANQASKGDPYTAWARMAMMVAAMAALGLAVRGGGGSSGASLATTRQAETGTGTVLGDPAAKSKSIENALGLLKDVDTMTMKYSAGMLASLRNIETSMAGVTTQILRTGGGIATGTNMGIQTGLIARNQGDPLLQGSGIPGLKLLDNMTRSAPIIGPILNRLTGLWGKTTQEIIDAGIALNGTAADLAAGRGAAQYATVETRRSSWFGLSKSSRTEEVRQALDAGITAQFAKIFSGVGDSLVAASRAFGQPVETIRQQLAGYVIDIQHLSLKGLSAEDMKTAIAAAVGAQADRMAQSVRPGLEAFQRVGEGYYETVIRTASASEQAGQALSKLGLSVVSSSAVANKQAEDLGAEMVRAAILAAERGGSSITAITNSIEGTASDLVDAYASLLDVRTGMQQMGFGATDASFDLLSGAGGLDALTSGMQAFRERFATQEQSIGLLTAKMTQQFERLGVSLPANADGFATLVHAIDTTTEAGRRELGGLLALAPAYAQFLDDTGQAAEKLKTASEIAQERAGLERKLFELHGDTATLRELELQQLDKSNWPLQRRIWALQDEREKLAQLASAGKGIGSVVDELMGATAASAGTSKALAQANYDRDLAAARAGDVTASANIAQSARALIEQTKASSSTGWEVASVTSLIAEQLRKLPAYMAAQQQAAGVQPTAQTAAQDPATLAAQAAAASASSAAQQVAQQQDSTAVELQALRSTCADLLAEVKELRTSQAAGLASVGNASRRAADALEDALGSDGASFAVMVKG